MVPQSGSYGALFCTTAAALLAGYSTLRLLPASTSDEVSAVVLTSSALFFRDLSGKFLADRHSRVRIRRLKFEEISRLHSEALRDGGIFTPANHALLSSLGDEGTSPLRRETYDKLVRLLAISSQYSTMTPALAPSALAPDQKDLLLATLQALSHDYYVS